MRRRFRLMAVVGLIVFGAILAATLLQTPLYSAMANVIIDTRRENVVKAAEVLPGLAPDSSIIDSQVEILRSRQLAEQVVRKLGLMRDPEFNAALAKPGLKAKLVAVVRDALGAEPATLPRSPETTTIDAVLKRLAIRRVGLTFVMEIRFTAKSPAKAALIANTYVDQYLQGQLSGKREATSGASRYLEDQLARLRDRVQVADAEISRYRTANGLLSAQGATLTEQEISAYNQQLSTVRASQAEEEARLRTARQQMAQGSNGGDVGEALSSEVIQSLRARRAEVSGRVADLGARYGPRHPELIRAQQELSDIDGQIQAEIRRIVSNLEARVSVARERTGSMQSSLGRARGALASNTAAGVHLAELEREAASLRTSQESLMQRFQETTAQRGLQRSDARVVSRAAEPARPASPRVLINLLLGLTLAGAAASAAAILAEMVDNGLTTSEEVETKLGVPHLGSLPLLSSVAQPRDRAIAPIDYLSSRPLSAFSESFRALRASVVYAGEQPSAKVVLLTSALPAEGKTTTAIGLARVSAQAGFKVLLLDCDLRRRSATRALRLAPALGVAEVLADASLLDKAILRDDASGAYVLPASEQAHSKDVFIGRAAEDLLARLRRSYDLIVIDTPPVLALADARALAAQSDAVVLLARWRKTPARAVAEAVKLLQSAGAPMMGIALSLVDMKAQSQHGYGDAGYYYNEYKKYYSA